MEFIIEDKAKNTIEENGGNLIIKKKSLIVEMAGSADSGQRSITK